MDPDDHDKSSITHKSNNNHFDFGGCFRSDVNIIEYFSNANLFILCCVIATFSLISYLAAFSCEVSWLLESHGDLPTVAYLLCIGYFILFVATTILIHGLATGLSWGLFGWAIVMGALSIPELCFVMIMTTQHWGLQSTHGLTELVGYLIRLVINCMALLCVIPTALRWRKEQKVLMQLQGLATRLQLTTPQPNSPLSKTGLDSLRSSRMGHHSRRGSGVDNPGFYVQEINSQLPSLNYPPGYGNLGSQNEFNASVFGLNASQYIGPYPPVEVTNKKTRSLLDLRYVSPAHLQLVYDNKANDFQQVDGFTNRMYNEKLRKNSLIMNDEKNKLDPIYYTISSDKGSKQLTRNCVSMENLNGLSGLNGHDMSIYGKNIIENYNTQGWPLLPGFPPSYQYIPALHFCNHQSQFNGYGGYTNPNPYSGRSNTNSKQSLGTESDDYRKYRDVAL